MCRHAQLNHLYPQRYQLTQNPTSLPQWPLQVPKSSVFSVVGTLLINMLWVRNGFFPSVIDGFVISMPILEMTLTDKIKDSRGVQMGTFGTVHLSSIVESIESSIE